LSLTDFFPNEYGMHNRCKCVRLTMLITNSCICLLN